MPEGAFAAFHRDTFDGHYRFAEVLLDNGLIWPALEHCLKCSHLFNVLDASSSIGGTERTAYILRVRQLAVGIAKAYVEDSTASDGTRLAEALGEGRKGYRDGPRTVARARLRGIAGLVAARPDEPDRRGGRRAVDRTPASARSARRG